MKLHKVHVREFKSVWDSNAFEVDKITCLVGKNEAGKTALLQALYRLNPIVPNEASFDVTDDYPRSAVEDYRQDCETGRRKEAVVIETTFLLDPDELEAITAEYGKGVLKSPEITVSRGYARNETGSLTLWVSVPVNEAALVTHLVESYGLPDAIRNEALQQPSLVALSQFLLTKSRRDAEAVAAKQTEANQLEDEVAKAAAMEEARTLAESQQAQSLRARLASLQRHPDIGIHIWQTILQPHFPTFLYFDEYYQLRGHDNVGALMQRKAANILERSDHPLLGLIELARLDLDKLLSPTRTQELKNKLQGASNHLSRQILKHWSQNKHLQILFDVRPALAG